MLDGAPGNPDINDLLAKVVCNVSSRECMVHRCDVCPGASSLSTYLSDHFASHDYSEEDVVTYRQWVHVDRDELITSVCNVKEYIEKLTDAVDQLTTHHYIAKAQGRYYKQVKENLTDSQALVTLDFAENYTFLIQDAIQGFHWNNDQATLHPFSIYNKGSHYSFCVFSDHQKHVNDVVYTFLKAVLARVKQDLPHIDEIVYFSDGAGSQYKNFKNFNNLMHHSEDFGIKASWNFYATSHGKNTCDGIGGTVKRLASRHSLQGNMIKTAQDLFTFCNDNIHSVTSIYVPSREVVEQSKLLESRHSGAPKVPGCRDAHRFVPVGNMLEVYTVSEDETPLTHVSYQSSSLAPSSSETPIYNMGMYVAVWYDGKWWIGMVSDYDVEQDDYKIKFMHPSGTKQKTGFYWPSPRDDQCWVIRDHIICEVKTLKTQQGRTFQLDPSEVSRVKDIVTKIDK